MSVPLDATVPQAGAPVDSLPAAGNNIAPQNVQDPTIADDEPSPDGTKYWEHVVSTMTQYDEKMVSNWKDELNNLLIFAGLFSAVITAFNVESYQWLEQQPEDRTNEVLERMSSQLSAFALSASSYNSTNQEYQSKDTPTFVANSTDAVINALWFSSLALSLMAALFAILTQQWIRNYADLPLVEGVERACIRQKRFNALRKWSVPRIIASIAVLLQLALFVFFGGLLVLLWSMHPQVALAVTLVMGIPSTGYFLTTILPTFAVDCPYRSPLSRAFNALICLMIRLIISPLSAFIRTLRRLVQCTAIRHRKYLDTAINAVSLEETLRDCDASLTVFGDHFSYGNWKAIDRHDVKTGVTSPHMRSALRWTAQNSPAFGYDQFPACFLRYVRATGDEALSWLSDITKRTPEKIQRNLSDAILGFNDNVIQYYESNSSEGGIVALLITQACRMAIVQASQPASPQSTPKNSAIQAGQAVKVTTQNHNNLTNLALWLVHHQRITVDPHLWTYLSTRCITLNVLHSPDFAVTILGNLLGYHQTWLEQESKPATDQLSAIWEMNWLPTVLHALYGAATSTGAGLYDRGALARLFELLAVTAIELEKDTDTISFNYREQPRKTYIGTPRHSIKLVLKMFKVSKLLQKFWFRALQRLCERPERTPSGGAQTLSKEKVVETYFHSAFPDTELETIYAAIDGNAEGISPAYGPLKQTLKANQASHRPSCERKFLSAEYLEC